MPTENEAGKRKKEQKVIRLWHLLLLVTSILVADLWLRWEKWEKDLCLSFLL
jgi:hypothetical protein